MDYGVSFQLYFLCFCVDGGFVKYSFPMAFSTTLIAWGVQEFRNAYLASQQIPHVMNALKWATDYFVKCHVSPFELYGQVKSKICDRKWKCCIFCRIRNACRDVSFAVCSNVLHQKKSMKLANS